MAVIKLPRLHKTLAIASTLVAVNFNVVSVSSSTLVPDVSTATRDRLPGSKLSMQGQAVAQLPSNTNNSRRQRANRRRRPVSQNPNPQLPDPSSPGRRVSGGTRGTCPRVDPRLTALVPETSNKVVLGLTAQERPTLWFYVPYALTSETRVEFVLQDDQHTPVYTTSIEESQLTPGVVGVKLPPSAPALEVGKQYYWYFLVFCGDSGAYAEVQGWVERVALNPELKRKLEQATPQDSVALYTTTGLWFEPLTTLANLRRQNPNDAKLEAEWEKLLKAIGLDSEFKAANLNFEALAQAPMVECCTPTP